jgi:hypothetical protein
MLRRMQGTLRMAHLVVGAIVSPRRDGGSA